MKKAVEERLAETARLKAEGDPVMEEILLWHLRYNWGKGRNPRKSRVDEPDVINGVKFWRVGHNASHEFYLGTDGNGRKFRYSVGESVTRDMIDISKKCPIGPGTTGISRRRLSLP